MPRRGFNPYRESRRPAPPADDRTNPASSKIQLPFPPRDISRYVLKNGKSSSEKPLKEVYSKMVSVVDRVPYDSNKPISIQSLNGMH